MQHLPQATVREFGKRGHQSNKDLSEIAADIEAYDWNSRDQKTMTVLIRRLSWVRLF